MPSIEQNSFFSVSDLTHLHSLSGLLFGASSAASMILNRYFSSPPECLSSLKYPVIELHVNEKKLYDYRLRCYRCYDMTQDLPIQFGRKDGKNGLMSDRWCEKGALCTLDFVTRVTRPACEVTEWDQIVLIIINRLHHSQNPCSRFILTSGCSMFLHDQFLPCRQRRCMKSTSLCLRHSSVRRASGCYRCFSLMQDGMLCYLRHERKFSIRIFVFTGYTTQCFEGRNDWNVVSIDQEFTWSQGNQQFLIHFLDSVCQCVGQEHSTQWSCCSDGSTQHRL